jgi:hypothetical protein
MVKKARSSIGGELRHGEPAYLHKLRVVFGRAVLP